LAKSPPKTETARETTPQHFPEVAPPAYAQAVGASYLVESMMQMQQSIGEMKATMGHLKTSSDNQSKKLDRVSHIIFAAGVVLTIGIGIGGFVLNKVWDGVVTMVATSGQASLKSQSQQIAPGPKTDRASPQ
jgi:hypothetical protein